MLRVTIRMEGRLRNGGPDLNQRSPILRPAEHRRLWLVIQDDDRLSIRIVTRNNAADRVFPVHPFPLGRCPLAFFEHALQPFSGLSAQRYERSVLRVGQGVYERLRCPLWVNNGH